MDCGKKLSQTPGEFANTCSLGKLETNYMCYICDGFPKDISTKCDLGETLEKIVNRPPHKSLRASQEAKIFFHL